MCTVLASLYSRWLAAEAVPRLTGEAWRNSFWNGYVCFPCFRFTLLFQVTHFLLCSYTIFVLCFNRHGSSIKMVHKSSLFLHTSSSKSKASHEPGSRYAFEKYSAQRKPTYSSRFLSSWRFVFKEVIYGIYELPDEFCSSHNHWSESEIKFNWQKWVSQPKLGFFDEFNSFTLLIHHNYIFCFLCF